MLRATLLRGRKTESRKRLPDGPTGLLGKLVVNTETGEKEYLQDVPPVVGQGDCGMLDILAHPDYEKNGWIYFAYTTGDTSAITKNSNFILF